MTRSSASRDVIHPCESITSLCSTENSHSLAPEFSIDPKGVGMDLRDTLGDNAIPGLSHIVKVEVTSTLLHRDV
jgi:hypothetical protein